MGDTLNPFAANNTWAYREQHRAQISHVWVGRADVLGCLPTASRRSALDGVAWNELGFAFPANYSFAAAAHTSFLEPFYLLSGSPSQQQHHRVILESDHVEFNRRLHSLTHEGHQLRHQGFASIDTASWGLTSALAGPSGLAAMLQAKLNAAEARGDNQLEVSSSGRSILLSGVSLAALLATVRPRLEAIGRDYLGSDAQLTSVKGMRNSSSPMWHQCAGRSRSSTTCLSLPP